MAKIEIRKVEDVIHNINVDQLYLDNENESNIKIYLQDNNIKLQDLKNHIRNSNIAVIKPIVLVDNESDIPHYPKYNIATYRDAVLSSILWLMCEDLSEKECHKLELCFMFISKKEYNERKYEFDIQSI